MDPNNAESPPPGVAIPDHTLIRCIGRGSYGQVWLARNIMNEFRAVKIIQRQDFSNDAPFQRELNGIRQFEPISRSHPGFVNVLHVGQDTVRNYFYYVMELGDDVQTGSSFLPDAYAVKTLDRMVRAGKKLSADEVFRLGLRLSDALHHLHEAGLVHRDIKPANIVFVGGLPKLADIGMVTSADAAQSIVGTLGYVPLEGPGTRQADIYALGKVLYECLTGFDRTRFPDLPTFFESDPEPDRFLELNEIIVKACHQDARTRYPTARQLHGELAAAENGQSIIRLRDLERKWARIKRWSRVAALGLLVGGVFAFFINREMTRSAQAKQRTVGGLVGSSMRAVQDGDYGRALQDSARAISLLQGDRAERLNRLRYGITLSQMPKLTGLQALGAGLNSTEFKADGSAILVARAGGRCELVSVESWQPLVQFVGHTNGVMGAVFAPDGMRIATAGADGTARIWDAGNGRELVSLPHPQAVTSVAFHPHTGEIVTGATDGFVRWWDGKTGELLQQRAGHSRQVDCVRFSHNGELLASGGRDNRLVLWNAVTREPAGEPIRHLSWVLCAAFSPDDSRLATGCAADACYVWAVDLRSLVIPPIRHERAVRWAEFSPDGRRLATASWDNTVGVWNAGTGEREEPILGHSDQVLCLNFSPDGRRLTTGCADGSLRVWDFAGKAVPRRRVVGVLSGNGDCFAVTNQNRIEVRTLAAPDSPRCQIAVGGELKKVFLSDDGRHVAAFFTGRGSHLKCQIWDALTGQSLSPEIGLNPSAARCCFDHGGAAVAIVDDGFLQVVNVKSGKPRFPPVAIPPKSREITFSPDGRAVAFAAGVEVHLLDARSGRPLFGPLKHDTSVGRVLFSPDSRRFVTCTSDAMMRACCSQIWDSHAGQAVGPKLWHRDGVRDAAWFPGGKSLVTVSEDGVGKIWQSSNGQPMEGELRHKKQIEDVAVSTDARLLLTASRDRTAQLWDAESGIPVSPPLRHSYELSLARFTPGGTQFVAQEYGGDTWVNSLPATDWPVPVLEAFARLYRGQPEASITGDQFQLAAKLAESWHQLKATYPDSFTVSREDWSAWHRMEKEHCKVAKLRPAELFHIHHMLLLDPQNRSLLARQKQIEQALSNESRSP